MRIVAKSAVLGVAIVVALYAVWEIGVFVTGFFTTPRQAASVSVAAKPMPEPPAAKPKARPVRRKAPEPEPEPPPPPAAVKRVVPFPTARDIPPGTGREALRAEFGEPNLRASLYDRGSLLETFVYMNRSRDVATYARLQNGSVIAAATAGMQ